MESNHAISTVEIKQQMQVLQAEKKSVRNQINDVTMKIMAPVVDNRSAWERTSEGSFLEIDTNHRFAKNWKFSKVKSDFLMKRSKAAGKSLIAY